MSENDIMILIMMVQLIVSIMAVIVTILMNK